MDWEADERMEAVFLLLDAVAKVLVDLDASREGLPTKDVAAHLDSAVNARLLAEQSPSAFRSVVRGLEQYLLEEVRSRQEFHAPQD